MATREAWKEGFEGEVARMGLPDLIQVSAHNRFSGCITVQYEELRGLVFFRDGAVVHAEQGEKVGEDAFHDILSWPAGRFSQQPSLSTTRATIHKACEHLLLDAHRVMDERRAARKAEPPPLPQEAPRQGKRLAVVEQLRRIRGVTALVVQAKDGARLESDGYEAEVLAGHSLYLAMAGNQLGALFGAGDVQAAAVHGGSRHLLLFATKSHYLGIEVQGGEPLGPVEAEVRKVLAGGR